MAETHPMMAVLKHMRDAELNHLGQGGGFSRAYLDVRRTYVDYVWEIMESQKASHRAIHLAIRLMDSYVYLDEVVAAAFDVVALTSKFEEVETPQLSSLAGMATGVCSDHILSMERKILTQMKWNINIPTVAHFAGILVALLQPLLPQAEDAVRLHTFASFYTDLAVQDTSISVSHAPSLVGAAAVLAARYHLCMDPVLPSGLELYAGYTPEVLLTCMRELLLCYERVFNEHPRVQPAAAATPQSNKVAAEPEQLPSPVLTIAFAAQQDTMLM